MSKTQGPRVLLLDIETAPIKAHVWGLWENNVSLNQIEVDWHLLSWAAKWLDDPPSKVMYSDQRHAKNIEDDRTILRKIWELMDQADIIISQNGKKFDTKKLNARFILNGLNPPSSYKQIDTLVIAKKYFAFTSNKLEYMSEKLNTKYKKLKHKKFPGHEMWSECLKGNMEAWKEMEVYNKHDVLSLEELYTKLIPWDNSVNFNLYTENGENVCKCGNTNFKPSAKYYFTTVGKFQKYTCTKCGTESRDNQNLFDKEKKLSLKRGTVR